MSNKSENYSFYPKDNIILPQVSCITKVNQKNAGKKINQTKVSNDVANDDLVAHSDQNEHFYKNNQDRDPPLFIPHPPIRPRTDSSKSRNSPSSPSSSDNETRFKRIRNTNSKVLSPRNIASPESNKPNNLPTGILSGRSKNIFDQPGPSAGHVDKHDPKNTLVKHSPRNGPSSTDKVQLTSTPKDTKILSSAKSSSVVANLNYSESVIASNGDTPKKEEKSDQDLIDSYKTYLSSRYKRELGLEDGDSDESKSGNSDDDEDDDSDFSLSSLEGSTDSDNDSSEDFSKTLKASMFDPLYSLPIKNRTSELDQTLTPAIDKTIFDNLLITSREAGLSVTKNIDGYNILPISNTGSLPDLRNCDIRKVTHVLKNDFEADSEPGGKLSYKCRPLPPIPSKSTTNSSNLYETIDHFQPKQSPSKLNVPGNDNLDPNNVDGRKSKHSFKQLANILTLVPRLTTNSVRSRKQDHVLADISQYLPGKKLTIFVGTWNMKGTKMLPDSLDDYLLPTESTYLQDIYVIGTQEGTPFRREWQMRLQETFGPSHVLMQSSNFGVLQLSVFVRRELVWFCTGIEQDTTATRMGHKIKTKGALAMSFSVFGTSLLFITSHFTSHEGRLKDRINDYWSICRNIQLPFNQTIGEKDDVTTRFDQVFWFGDFNFRVKQPREYVDKLIAKHKQNPEVIIKDLLGHDQLFDVFRKGKIFHGFHENPIQFMPTYKFDVNSNKYDSSSKQRVPSWTDRILHRSNSKNKLSCVCYNSCDSVKNSDHRPVYAIFETTLEAYKSKFSVPGANFDRDVYVEANLRRSAPSGSQQNSHVCVIL